MNKIIYRPIFALCVLAVSSTALGYGNLSSSIAVTGGNRLSSGKSYAISITIPAEFTSQSTLNEPTSTRTTSGEIRFVDFNAKNIPVHELPPLPLTLDAPEQEP